MDESKEVRNLCDNIKFLRRVTKLSKEKMSKLLGISARSLTAIEKGTLPPRLGCEFLVEVYRKFGIEPIELFYEWDFEKILQAIEK